MKKWGFRLNAANIALILLGTGLDLLGRWVAKRLFLPFWLDSIGTFLSAVMLGPVAGAISGGLMNVIVNFFEPGQIWFALVSIGGGAAVGLFFPRERKIEPFTVIATALFAGFVMTVISTPLNLYFNGGYVGHPWGDALVDMLAPDISLTATRCLLGGLLVNMPDKAVSIVLVMSVLFLVRRRKKEQTQNGAAMLAAALLPAALAAAMTTGVKAADFGSEYAAVIYGRDDGLISAEINAVEQTADGYIWAGAYSGLYRYNGSKFEQIRLNERISNAICLHEDGAGKLWIGTNDSGVACYHPDTGAVDFYTAADGLASDSVRALCGDGAGSIYVGTAAELCRIDADGAIHVFSGYPQLSGVYSLCALGAGQTAGVTSGGVLFVVRDDRLVFCEARADGDVSYTAVAYDGNGEVFVGTSESELDRFQLKEDGSLEAAGTARVPGLSDVNCIRYAPEENGYFVAASVGLAFVNRNMETQNLSMDGFSSAASDVIVDYQGNVWFASSKQGVMKLSRNPFLNVSHKAGMEETAVNALLLDDGRLYIGTDTGLVAVNASTCGTLFVPAANELEGERVRHLMKDRRGNIWVSTYGRHGLMCIYPDGSWKTFENDGAMLGSRFRFALELSGGTVLAASTEGLNYIRDGLVVRALDARDGLTLPKILCAAECPDGVILAGSDGDGVYRIKDGEVIGNIGTAQGLQSLVVMRIVPCGGGYVYVTSNGLYFQDPDTANAPVRRLKAFPYNNNYDVYVPGDGRVWVSSSAGLYVANEEAFVNDEGYRCVLLDHHRGFDTTLTANAWNAVDGDQLYLCCTDGVRRIDTKTFDDWNDNYRIVMASLTVEGVPVECVDGVYQLPSGRGRVQLWPAVLNYAVADPLISIHIEGTDDPGVLIHQSEMTQEYYTTLSHGDCQVHVEILDELTGATKKEAYFPLHKDAELYERTFYRIYLVFVAAMLVAFLAWMVAKMSNMAIINRQYDQIKEAKEEAELANQSKSRFLANMSHEIRTPINAVLGMDEMILRESSEPEIRGYAADIYTAGNTLLSLINDILDSSKIESGKMEIVPVEYELPTLVRDLCNMISQRAQAKDLTLEVEVDPSLPHWLYGDDVRVRQVVTNILTNAVKYTPSGTVWFRVGGTRDGEDLILHIEVEDTGIGIKEEDLPKLFEAFQRIEEGRNRNIEGTGLGMNITIQLLDMMGSRLDVESVYGKGSKFFFDLRQKIVDDTPIGDFSAHERAAGDSYRYEGAFIAPEAKVLVVDDNAMNRKVFRSLMKQTQMQITEAGGGEESLRLAANERFDMVFMDHMMPGMDGVEAMRRMREIEGYDKIPILALTANAVTGAKEQYLEMGFDGFLSKPVVADKLEAAVCELLPPTLLKPYEAKAGEAKAPVNAMPEDLPSVDGLDWSYAWLHLPERELLISTVREFRETLPLQADKLDKMWTEVERAPQDEAALSAYRIHVHGMKSAAATIGIVPLAGMAKLLEFAARDGDVETMRRLHGVFDAEWRSYGEKLKTVCGATEDENAAEKETADADMLRAMLGMLKTALEDFDVDAADETVQKIRSYAYAPEIEALLPQLAAAVTALDEDEANTVMDEIGALL